MSRGAEALQCSTADQMASRVEGVVDRRQGGQEPLRRGLGFEPLLLPLVLSDRQVAVFSPIVLPQSTGTMEVLQAEFAQRSAVGSEPIRDDGGRFDGLVSDEPAQQFQRRRGVPFPLHYKVQHLALVIDGPPQVHPLAADLADHLVQMPARRRRHPAPLQAPGELGPELDRPAPDRLVADVDAALGEQLLNVPKAEREAEIQPHRMADYVRRKPVTLERQ